MSPVDTRKARVQIFLPLILDWMVAKDEIGIRNNIGFITGNIENRVRRLTMAIKIKSH